MVSKDYGEAVEICGEGIGGIYVVLCGTDLSWLACLNSSFIWTNNFNNNYIIF